MEQNTKHIELRSEKVRNIIGTIPPFLLRQGTGIIAFVLLLMLLISTIIPYRKTIAVQLHLHTVPKIQKVYAPADGIVLFQNPQNTIAKNTTIAHLQYENKLIPLKTTVKGKVIKNTGNNSIVKKGELLFLVVPENIKYCYAEAIVPQDFKHLLKKETTVNYTNSNNVLFEGHIKKVCPYPVDNYFVKVIVTFNCNTFDNFSAPILQGQILVKKSSYFSYFLDNINN